MSDSEVWTVGRLLEWTTDYLKQQDASSPRLDAEVLLAAARGCERIELYTAFSDEPAEDVRAKFRDLVRRRAAGEPVAYLVGHREFYSLAFKVTPDVLIPRPETELVIVALLDEVKRIDAAATGPLNIADVGTGSGVLAVCAAKKIANCQVAAIDISKPALEVAKHNVERHGVAAQVEFVESDLFEQLSNRQFDFVVSNPPYVSELEMRDLPSDVADYEPHTALLAGKTGTEVIERLVVQAAARLKPPGSLIIEISPMLEERVHRIITQHAGLEVTRTVKDLAGHARVVVAQRAE
jgi:release factor glutamine methyltransferase